MPDPLLEKRGLEIEYSKAQRSAAFYGAEIWREENFIFLKCKNQHQDTLLARIDCKGYPENPPDVTFLDPSTKLLTTDIKFWPSELGPLKSGGEYGICLAGTRAYAEHHGTLGGGYGLGKLVEIVILCCCGQKSALLGAYNKRR